MSPVHATRTHMTMNMLYVEAGGMMRNWIVRLKSEATRLKPIVSQSVWFTCSFKKWRAFRLTPRYFYPALSFTQRHAQVLISRSVGHPAATQILLAAAMKATRESEDYSTEHFTKKLQELRLSPRLLYPASVGTQAFPQAPLASLATEWLPRVVGHNELLSFFLFPLRG